ncbi:uncharacterized protein Dere_GG26490, partial [Drosophila erecta]
FSFPLQIDGAQSGLEKSNPFYIKYKIKEAASQPTASTPKYGKNSLYPTQNAESKPKLPLYSRSSRDKLICHLHVDVVTGTADQILLAGTALIVEDY